MQTWIKDEHGYLMWNKRVKAHLILTISMNTKAYPLLVFMSFKLGELEKLPHIQLACGNSTQSHALAKF